MLATSALTAYAFRWLASHRGRTRLDLVGQLQARSRSSASDPATAALYYRLRRRPEPPFEALPDTAQPCDHSG